MGDSRSLSRLEKKRSKISKCVCRKWQLTGWYGPILTLFLESLNYFLEIVWFWKILWTRENRESQISNGFVAKRQLNGWHGFFLVIFLESLYFCSRDSDSWNGTSLFGVDKLTLRNSIDSGCSRSPNFKWVCRQKTVEWLTWFIFSYFSWVHFFFSLEILIRENVRRVWWLTSWLLRNLETRENREGQISKLVCRQEWLNGWLKKFPKARENREANFQNVYAANDSWLVDMGIS